MVTKKSNVYVSWPEPQFELAVKTNKKFRSYFHAAMLYAHYELTPATLKKEALNYIKKLDPKHPLLADVKTLDENRFTTIGKYMYVANHGGDIPDDILPGLIPALEKLINAEKNLKIDLPKKVTDTAEIPVVKVTISIQDRLREKAREVAGEVEGWLDEFFVDRKLPIKTTEDYLTLFKLHDLKAPHAHHIKSLFSKRVDELITALEGKDKDLIEAYSNYSKQELKKYYMLNENLIKACDMLLQVAKVDRTPRKKKPVSLDKLVAKLKYKKDDKALGLVSLSPSSIIGASEIWVYNTKTRKIAQYKSIDGSGLTVKGTSLLNFSTDSAEKTVRKPAETLADFKKATKVKLRTFLKELSTLDIPANGKLNEHHIILRIDK
jgi:hypothetical protein